MNEPLQTGETSQECGVGAASREGLVEVDVFERAVEASVVDAAPPVHRGVGDEAVWREAVGDGAVWRGVVFSLSMFVHGLLEGEGRRSVGDADVVGVAGVAKGARATGAARLEALEVMGGALEAVVS